MRRAALGCALLLALAWPAWAEEQVGPEETAPAASISKAPLAEYAFNKPEVLTAQLLWGVAHGARLLALACAGSGQHAAAEAWVDWREREQPQILAAGRLLGRHYFGSEEISPAVISAALGLKPALALPPEALGPACETLAQALAQPRYDLSRFHAMTLELLQRGGKTNSLEVLK